MMASVALVLGALVLMSSAVGGDVIRDRRLLQDSDYIDYLPGTLNVILAAPHGGNLNPSDIPDRDAGCWVDDACVYAHDCGSKDFTRCSVTTVTDSFTWQLTELLRDELFAETGQYPHVIINKLLRRKLDANREINEAAFNVPAAMQAWDTFHSYIDQAKEEIGGRGLFYDMHGHGHPEQWAELGYLITGSNLDSGNFDPEETSIRNLAAEAPYPFEQVLRGDLSFGHLLHENDFDSVPSPVFPGPDGASFFSGGYNTRRHGSRDGGEIDGIQIESPSSFRQEEMRPAYAKALAKSIREFLEMHYLLEKRDNGDANGSIRKNSYPSLLVVLCLSVVAILQKL